MCAECGGNCGKSVNGQSTLIKSYGPESAGQHAFSQLDPTDAFIREMQQQSLHLKRISRQTFDKSRPLDEYAGLNSPPPLTVSWLPEMALPVRIESLMVSLPVGITSAVLQLGQRYIPMYSGAATTVQGLWNPQGLGIILGESDNRGIVFTGAPTSGYYVQLSGFCLERDGNR